MSDQDKLYIELSEEESSKQRELLIRSWAAFLRRNDPALSNDDFFINGYALLEVVERVSKRKFYFKVFYGIDHLSEFKELAIICYWICKLKPFTILKTESKLCASCNELFAVQLVLVLLEKCKGKAVSYRRPDKVTISNLVYSLKYQPLTKESLVQYMECLALSCGIDIRTPADSTHGSSAQTVLSKIADSSELIV